MGLRGPAEARPARGDEPARGGRSGAGPGPRQAADPGDLPPRRRGARPGHQGEHRHQGADPLDLHQHPRPLPRAHARPEPRRRLAQDRRRRPAPQAPRDHARAQPAQGPGLHRQDRRPRADQARAGPRPGLPAAALEGHPPPDQEVQGADADLSRIGHDHPDDPRYLQLRDRHDLDRRARGLRAGPGLPQSRHAAVRQPPQALRRKGARSSTSTASRTRSPRFSAGTSRCPKAARS